MSTDAVRAALAELVACHTEEAGLTMSMVANRADFDAFMERCDQRLAAALDAARAALSEPEPSVGVPDGYRLVPFDVLRDARDALSSFFCEDGWTQRDEKALDALNVHIATTPQEPTP